MGFLAVLPWLIVTLYFKTVAATSGLFMSRELMAQ